MKTSAKHWLRRVSLLLIMAMLLPCIPCMAFAEEEIVDMDAVNYIGQHKVTASSLRVRSGPGTGYGVVGYVYRGDYVNVTSVGSTYSRITTDSNMTGWAANEYLTPVGTEPTTRPTTRPTVAPTVRPTTSPTQSTGVDVYRVNTSALNLRSGPGTGYNKLETLYRNDYVYKVSATGNWMRVYTEDRTYGYVMISNNGVQYIVYSHTEGGPTAKPTATPKPTVRPTATTTPITTPGLGPGEIYITTSNVNLRSGPGTSYGVSGILYTGSYLTLISKYNATWYRVRTIEGEYGYLNQNYIRYVRTASTFEPYDPNPTSTPAPIVDDSKQVYSYSQMKTDLNALKKRYSDMVNVYSIGTTYWGDTIPVVFVGNQYAAHSLLIDASIHGREYMSTLMVMKQLEYVLSNLDNTYKGSTYRSMLQNCNILLVPMINPDGVYLSQYGVGSLSNQTVKNNLISMNNNSTNFTRWKANSRGVDLNRNFSAGWIYTGTPGPAAYSGASAMSEQETNNLANFVNSRTRIRASINYHCTGNYIYWHYGQTGDARTRDQKLASQISSITGYYLKDEVYGAAGGGFMDWMIQEKGLPSITIELGQGDVEAPQPISAFPALWNANKDIPGFMLWYITSNG